MTPMLPRIDRTWTSARRPPRAPGDALIRVATLPLNATRGGSPGAGRDAQSMAFFRTAVMELLYSGEAISRPSWSMKSCLSFWPFSGIPCSASRSWSNTGKEKSLRSIIVTSAPASRAPLAAMGTSFLLKDSLRVLPAKASTRVMLIRAPPRSVIDRATSGCTGRLAPFVFLSLHVLFLQRREEQNGKAPRALGQHFVHLLSVVCSDQFPVCFSVQQQ